MSFAIFIAIFLRPGRRAYPHFQTKLATPFCCKSPPMLRLLLPTANFRLHRAEAVSHPLLLRSCHWLLTVPALQSSKGPQHCASAELMASRPFCEKERTTRSFPPYSRLGGAFGVRHTTITVTLSEACICIEVSTCDSAAARQLPLSKYIWLFVHSESLGSVGH